MSNNVEEFGKEDVLVTLIPNVDKIFVRLYRDDYTGLDYPEQ